LTILQHITKALPILKNKYVLSVLVFLVWMAFFDQYDLKTIFKLRSELDEIKESSTYYEEQIKQTKAQLNQLQENPKAVEKFARERYLMKKKEEDIFIISKEKTKK